MSRPTQRAEQPTPLWPPVDPLGEALHFLRMSGAFYTRCELTAPWGLALPALPGCLMFHVVTSGRCWLDADGIDPRLLDRGDFALVPHGEGHGLSSETGAPMAKLFDLPREQVSERYEILRHGRGGAPTTLVCGAVRFDHPAAQRLVALLPRLLTMPTSGSPRTEWIQSTLRLMGDEAAELQPGGEAIITRLADVLVIQAIRSWIATDPEAQTGWIGALRDPRIGRAILCIHRDPARAWTVASLATEVAMSRSAFAARFRDRVGESPMQYLTRWRMHLAATWLEDETLTLSAIASRLGYESEAAFGHAFKRHVGVAPGSVRRTGRAV